MSSLGLRSVRLLVPCRPALLPLACLLLAGGFAPGGTADASTGDPAAIRPPVAGPAPDYLGQPPPGNTAVMFARGIVSDGHLHGTLAISRDGRDLCWTTFSTADDGQGAPSVVRARIMHVARTADGWTAPRPLVPDDQGMTAEPLFSPDGTRLYFNFTTDLAQGWQTRFIERTEAGWSEVRAGGPLLVPGSSFTKSGRVYYTAPLAGKPWNRGIHVADFAGGTYRNASALPATINSPFIDYTPYVAPDESCLMFSSSRPSAEEDMFLYVSFRGRDGSWAQPCRMNEALGFAGNARFPSLSPDGRFLFFCGDDGNMYWVRSEVLGRLRDGCRDPAR